MNIKSILNGVGLLLMLLSGVMLIPAAVSLYFSQPALEGYMSAAAAFGATLLICVAAGLTLFKAFPSDVSKLRDREGFAMVAFSWFFISLAGAFPYYLTGATPLFVDAFFESMSGFTTTGSSILRDIEAVPKGLLFWRNLSQWLGGMGIIMLSLAILPALGLGSSHLFKAEIPGGATVERMQPRLAETAKILWRVYLVLTLAEIVLLRFGGVGYFDAVCHAFSTVATGGFSPYQQSVAGFNSGYVESVVVLFMFLGGLNFALLYQGVHGNFGAVYKNTELRIYVYMIAAGVLVATWGLSRHTGDPMGTAFRNAAFTVVSVNTTTGFATDDFDLWPNYLRLMLLGFMVVGGCSGSTSGSLKVIRLVILIKVILREIRKLIHPRAVIHIKIGGKTVEPDQIMSVTGLIALFMGFFACGAILLSSLGMDLTSAITASIAALFNIGPGMGTVGATGNYADVPELGKWWLSFCMLMGRLEIYGVVLLLFPMAWKK